MNLKEIYALHGELSSRLGPHYYLDQVVINSSPEPRSWRLIREKWQDELLAPKIPAFENLAGLRPSYDGPMRFWDTLARGHDKSSLEGRLTTSLLLCSRRIIEGYIIAADRDQGKLLMQAMKDEAQLNPWVASRLTFAGDTVKSDRGQVQVVPADAGGAYGARGNLFIFDEVTNWKRAVCREVWTSVMSGTAKRHPVITVVLANAGYLKSWQHEAWEAAVANPEGWATFYRTGNLASWMSEKARNEARAMLAKSEGRRLFDNEWISAGEEADYLKLVECERCIKPELFYRISRAAGVKNYLASIDYGPKRDRTVCTIGHMQASGRVIVDRMDVFQGKDMGGMVQPSVVRRWVEEVEKMFDPCEYVIDPAGMLSEIEWMRNKNLPVYEYSPRGGKGNYELAMALRAMVSSGTVNWYENCGVVDGEALEVELSQLVTKVMPYGFRLDHTSTKHDDRAVSLGQLLVRASEFPAE